MTDRSRSMSRRRFLRLLAASGAGAFLAACGAEEVFTPTPRATVPPAATSTPESEVPAAATEVAGATEAPERRLTPEPTSGEAYLAVARGPDPRAITAAAVAAVGGIGRFVKAGDEVVVKPNICTDYYPYEYGATTNPEVVATLVELCLGAGARRVKVMDNPFGGKAESAYAVSGIADAVAAAGGEMVVMHPAKFRLTAIPQGVSMREWEIYQEILDADVLIDVPIAKHHNGARLSLGAKNLIGVVSNPGGLHASLHQRIADLTSLVRPHLTVVDAVRTLMRHGPTGGNLDDVQIRNTVIASHDLVAADAYATYFFDLRPEEVGYVRLCAEMGLGTMELEGLEIEEVSV